MPLHKIMQVTVFLYHCRAGTQHQMKGIAEDNISTDGLDITRQHALDRAISANRHKSRGTHLTTREMQSAGACRTALIAALKLHKTLSFSHWGCLSPDDDAATWHRHS